MRDKQKTADVAGDQVLHDETADDSAAGSAEEAGSVSAGDAPAVDDREDLAVAEEPATEDDAKARELEELQDRHLRLAAEFENYRKRTRRELAETRRRAQADLVAMILDVLDDLTRVSELPGDATLESLLEGVQLVEANMKKALGDAGLRRIEAAGARFDPNLHEALTTRPTEDPEEDDRISEVFREGYTFEDILVRPSRVVVNQFAPQGTDPRAEGRRPDDS